jgi:hypothetical protein
MLDIFIFAGKAKQASLCRTPVSARIPTCAVYHKDGWIDRPSAPWINNNIIYPSCSALGWPDTAP